MQERTTSNIAFVAAVAAAAMAAALMSGNAHAEGPILDIRPMTGALSRDAVKAETLANRRQLTSFATEYVQQHPAEMQASAITREQARDAYIAAREQVRAMTAEDSGSGWLAHMNGRAPQTMMAGATLR
jgi:hypothetical protein